MVSMAFTSFLLLKSPLKDVSSLKGTYAHLPFPYILTKLFQAIFHLAFSKMNHFIEKNN